MIGLWLSAALLAGEPVAANEAGRSVDRILEQDRYLFCVEGNDYVPEPGDHRWCELAEAEDFQRCPGLAEVCARAIGGLELADDELFGDDSEGDLDGPRQPEKKRPGDANKGAYEETEPLQLPDLGIFAKILMWALILGGALAVIVVIAKNFVRDRDSDDAEPEPEPSPDSSLIAQRTAAMRAVETDVARLLARAEQAAKRGEFEPAISDVYAALLRRLEGSQLVTIESWKTNGDYLSELRSRPPLRDEVREIIREVEQVQFGAAAAESNRYANIRAKVVAVVSRATLALALALGGGALLGCPLTPDPDELPSSSALAGLGTGPTDHRAVGELLLVHGIEAKHRTDPIDELAVGRGAIILLADVDPLPEDWDVLLRWVEDDGGTLIVATGKDFPRSLGIDYGVLESDAGLRFDYPTFFFSQLAVVAPSGRVLELADNFQGERLLVREPSGDPNDWTVTQPDATSDRVYVARRTLGTEGGEVIVFAEPDMLTNAGISVANNGALLLNLLASRDIDSVEFIDDYSGSGPDDPFESVGNAKLGGLFIQILLFLALLYAAVGIPFARLREPSSQRRRSFVEHVQTLGQRYAQARAARYVAGLYTAWALDRLRERTLPGTARGLHPLAQAIAARTGRSEASVMQLLLAAHDLRESSEHATRGSAADLELMRQLGQLLDEVGGKR